MMHRRQAGFDPLGWLAGALCLASLGCGQPFARLDGVVVDARPALPGELGRVQVIRQGKTPGISAGMSIEKGDQLATAVDGTAILTLRDGYEVIMEPGTEITIENPTIFEKIGKLIIKKLKEVKEALTVNSEFTSAGVEGTEFVYEVGRDRTVQIAVLEGHVTVRSRDGRWPSVTYGPGDAGTIRPGAAPGRMQQLDPAAARAIRQRVLEVEQAVRPEVPDVHGLREDEARGILTRAGLRPGSVSRVITRQVPAGIVVSTSPAAGATRRAGDRIALQVEDSSLVVPRLLGLFFGDAARRLENAGFLPPDTTSTYQPDARLGSVVAAAPGDGTAVSASTRIVLTLAHHTPPPADTARGGRGGQCTVPNLMERTEAVAIRLLTDAGLKAGKINRYETGRTVTWQRLRAGTPIRCGTAIDFNIGAVGE